MFYLWYCCIFLLWIYRDCCFFIQMQPKMQSQTLKYTFGIHKRKLSILNSMTLHTSPLMSSEPLTSLSLHVSHMRQSSIWQKMGFHQRFSLAYFNWELMLSRSRFSHSFHSQVTPLNLYDFTISWPYPYSYTPTTIFHDLILIPIPQQPFIHSFLLFFLSHESRTKRNGPRPSFDDSLLVHAYWYCYC